MATNKLKAVEESPLNRYYREIREGKQDVDKARMGQAQRYKDAEDAGLDRWGLKQIIRMKVQSEATTQQQLTVLVDYAVELGILHQDTKLYFMQTSLLDQAPTA